MKEIIKNPNTSSWSELCKRPTFESEDLASTVDEIFAAVKAEGDKAVLRYNKKFGGRNLKGLWVSSLEIKNSEDKISEELKDAIDLAYENIYHYHYAQMAQPRVMKTTNGITSFRKNIAIEKVGLYIPGGTAPLFSTALMLGVPAQIAGCTVIQMVSPPGEDGTLHPAILYAAKKCGVKKIYRAGGIQAIAALTYGTESVQAVHKIYGPGNQFVTAAKQEAVRQGVAIDMPAGPSELLVIAEKTANPVFVAADLLAQSEHGADSQVILLGDDEKLLSAILELVQSQVKKLPRKDIIRKALENSKCILLKDLNECMNFSNAYAPEHLILAVDKPAALAEKVINAGCVFMGHYTPESLGDYAAGPNHTLPTGGHAKAYGGLGVDSFVKKINFQHATTLGLQNLGPAVEIMAAEEQLMAHKKAVTLRLQYLKK